MIYLYFDHLRIINNTNYLIINNLNKYKLRFYENFMNKKIKK